MDGNHRGAGKRRSFLRIRNSCGEILANHEVIALTENNHEVIDMSWGAQVGGTELCINPVRFSSFHFRYFKVSLLKKVNYSSSYSVKPGVSDFFEGSLQEKVQAEPSQSFGKHEIFPQTVGGMDKKGWLFKGLSKWISTRGGKQLWQQHCGARSLCRGVYDGALCSPVHRKDEEYIGNECTFLQLKLLIYVFYVFWTESPILIAPLCFRRGV